MTAAAVAVMAACAVLGQAGQQTEHVPWTFRAAWDGGYSGWMSYPLSQDVGFDPSIYIDTQGAQAVLIRQFVSAGERLASFGMVRPLRFWADSSTAIQLQYNLNVNGELRDNRIILIAADGRHYQATLPGANGEHQVSLAAAAFSLRSPAKIVAVVMMGKLVKPAPGSRSRWTLERFEIHSKRPRQISILMPRMDTAENGLLVAREVVLAGGSLRISLAESAREAHVELYNGSGRQVASQTVPPEDKQISLPIPRDAAPGLWRAQIARGDAATTLRFLVLGDIPSHGYLLLSAKRIAQLRDAPRYAALRQEIHRRATLLASKIDYSAAAGDNIALMPSGPGIGPAFPGQILPYMTLVENYANTVSYNALDFRLNGNQQSLHAARMALLAMAQWRTWIPPRFQHHGLRTYYEIGCIAQRLAFGYDLIADQLSSDQRALVAKAFRQQAIEPVVEEYFLYNRDPIAASNWMANSVGGALAAVVSIAGDSPSWQKQDGPALADLEFALEQLLHGLFPGDGSEAEPAGYENFAMQGISWSMSALADLGIRPSGADAMLQGFWWPDYATVRPGRQLDTGDFDGQLKALSGFAWGAEHSGDPALRAFYDAGTDLNLLKGAAPDENGHHLEELQGPLDLVCCTGPAAPLQQLPPPSRLFPKRGSAVLRGGWDADSTVISLRVGPWFNHQHADEGTFQVAAFGRTVISEAGYASYYTDPHYADYFSQAAGHNTVLIDGNPFSQGAIRGRYWAGFKVPHVTSWLLGNSFDYLAADLAPAYKGRLNTYQRQYLFLKPDLLVIRDELNAPKPHCFSWLLHPVAGADIRTNGDSASIVLPPKPGETEVSASVLAAGAGSRWKIATVPVAVRQFSQLDGPRIPVPQELVLDSQPASRTTFLVGLRLKSGNAPAEERVEQWHEPSGQGLRISDETAGAVFRTAPGPLRAADLDTNGAVLGWHGGSTPSGWFVAGATLVMEAGHVLLHASTSVDAEWESGPAGARLTIANSSAVKVELYAAAACSRVQVDGKTVPADCLGKKLSLPELAPGHHTIRLLTASAQAANQ